MRRSRFEAESTVNRDLQAEYLWHSGWARLRAALINRRLRAAHAINSSSLRGDENIGGRYGGNYGTGILRCGDVARRTTNVCD